jgi:hypothetical protein
VPWADTLPFPLASILWHYEGEPDEGAKVDYLLKFFEALAEFVALLIRWAELSGLSNQRNAAGVPCAALDSRARA